MLVPTLLALVPIAPARPAAAPCPAQIPQRALSPCPVPPPGAALWSDPASWGGSVPQAGECATIPAGQTIYLDVSTARLGGLDVQGELIFLCRRLTLRADWILVTGSLQVGATTHPFHRKATIRLTNAYACDPTKENQTLAVEGQGLLRLIGEPRAPSWTRLAATALAGSTVLSLQSAPDWRAGQTVVVASTDFDMRQAEERTIQSVVGDQLVLTQPLAWTHWGATEGLSYDGVGLEERAEVALRERSIVVEGTPYVDGSGRTIAGHTLLRNAIGSGPRAELEWAEFRQLGKEGILARYPVHFHLLGDASGSYMRNCSIHHSYNRTISLHSSQNVVVEDNFSYDILGHAYFMEDDPAQGCTLRGNLGLLTKAAAFPILESDAVPATFWLHSPANTVEDNVAAGSQGYGFFFETDSFDPTPWTSFRGNVAHSNQESGFWQDIRPRPEPESVYEDLTAYKNRRYGFWHRSYGNSRIVGARMADNQAGFYFASEGFQFYLGDYFTGENPTGISTTLLQESLVVGETLNTGTPTTCEELAVGRSLPQIGPNHPSSLLPAWHALTGVEYYDGLIGVENTVFAEFRDKSVPTPNCPLGTFERKAAAVHSVFYNNPWAVDPRNYVEQVAFVNDASTVTVPIYLRTPIGLFSVCGTEMDDGGIANSIFQDRDGSMTGIAGSVAFPDNPFLIPFSSANFDPIRNAYVTSGPPSTPFAQLDFIHLNEFLSLPLTDKIGYHSLFRDLWFVKSGPVLDVCQPTVFRIARFVTNVVTDDIYEIYYDPAVSTDEWARIFMLTLQFTEPARWAYVTVPLLPPVTTFTVDVEGVPAGAATDPLALYNGPGNEYYYDLADQRIHLKILTGGSGTTIYDGHRTSFLVTSY